jgi:hypothetical protein
MTPPTCKALSLDKEGDVKVDSTSGFQKTKCEISENVGICYSISKETYEVTKINDYTFILNKYVLGAGDLRAVDKNIKLVNLKTKTYQMSSSWVMDHSSAEGLNKVESLRMSSTLCTGAILKN